MEGHYRGALVVQATAAHEIAVLFCHLKGLEVPTGAGRHHIHVPDDPQLRIGLARQVGKSDMTLAVGGGHAHALGDFQRRSQSGGGAGTIGRPGSGRSQILYRGNLHELGDVGHDGVAVRIPIGAGGGHNFLAIHRSLLSYLRFPWKRGTP